MRCELITWAEVQRLCQRLAALVRESGYRPDRVVAVARGGLVPGRLVCDCLDIMALSTIRVEHYLAGSAKQERAVIRDPLCTDIRGLKLLLVDDVNDGGDTLETAVQYLLSLHPRQIKTAVMHHKTTTRVATDYYAKKITRWRWLIYPWAVKEDISSFIMRLSRTPASLEEAQQLLAEQYGINIPLRSLEHVYEFMNVADRNGFKPAARQ